MEKLHLVPQGTFAVGETLKEAAVALVKGGQTKVRSYMCTNPILIFVETPFSSSLQWLSSSPGSQRNFKACILINLCLTAVHPSRYFIINILIYLPMSPRIIF